LIPRSACWLEAIEARPAVQRGVKVPVDLAALRRGDGEGGKRAVENAQKIVQRQIAARQSAFS